MGRSDKNKAKTWINKFNKNRRSNWFSKSKYLDRFKRDWDWLFKIKQKQMSRMQKKN